MSNLGSQMVGSITFEPSWSYFRYSSSGQPDRQDIIEANRAVGRLAGSLDEDMPDPFDVIDYIGASFATTYSAFYYFLNRGSTMRLENLFGLPIDVISRHPITKMLVEYFKDMNGYRHGREHGRKEVKRDESSSPTRAGAVDHSLEETERKNRSALVHACIRAHRQQNWGRDQVDDSQMSDYSESDTVPGALDPDSPRRHLMFAVREVAELPATSIDEISKTPVTGVDIVETALIDEWILV